MYSSSGDFSYYHQDELDSNRIVTDEDAVQLAEYKYKPFGGTHYSSGSDSSNRKFNEKRQEARASYLRFPARMYDHKRRTWTSADPLAQLSPRILLTDYTNPYAYCGQDPLNGTDPTGLGWGLDIAGGFADSLENFLVSGIDTLTGDAFSEAMGENFKTYTSENKGGWARGGRISGQGAAVVGAAWMAVSGAYGLAEMVVNGMGGAGGIMVTANGTTAVLALSPPAAVPSLALAKAVLASVYGTAVCANAAATPSGGKPLLGKNPRAGGKRTNTDLPGGKATGKSIFRNQSKGQRVSRDKTTGGGVRRTAADGTQIRHNPDGSTRVDLPKRGPAKIETIHFND